MLSNVRCGRVREVSLIIPDDVCDIYEIHQIVWSHVGQVLAKENGGVRPRAQDDGGVRFLYRRDENLIRVRAELFKNAGQVVDMPSDKSTRTLRIQIAPFRDAFSLRSKTNSEVQDYIKSLLVKAGFEVKDMRTNYLGLASGKKNKPSGGTLNIDLPVFGVVANVSIQDAKATHRAWIDGIGRGKRFGFGMPVLDHCVLH